MKVLSNFKLTSKYKSVKKELLSYDHYASLTKDDKLVHIGDILPEMTNIAIWDNTEENTFLINAREYDLDVYPEDRYLVIGVEAIPKEHVDGVHTKIISLRCMNNNTPKIGGNVQNHLYFGLYNVPIDGMEKKSYAPKINEGDTIEFGTVQEIKEFTDLSLRTRYEHLCRELFDASLVTYNMVNNPFALDNQGYVLNPYGTQLPYVLIPSPFDKNMDKNPIFFTENPDTEHPSCLLNFDGKGETEKILNQLNVNIGNDDWKNNETIENAYSTTNAPIVQCTWMYCVKEGYETNPIFGQGCWYIPTIGELAYYLVRENLIANTILHINEKNPNLEASATTNMYCSNIFNDATIASIQLPYCYLGFTYRDNRFYETKAFSII